MATILAFDFGMRHIGVATGNTVTKTATAQKCISAKDGICLAGSMDASGAPLLPVGLGGWLPAVGSRSGLSWQTYINQKFFNVERKAARRLQNPSLPKLPWK